MIAYSLKWFLMGKGWTNHRPQKESGIAYPTPDVPSHGRSQDHSVAVLEKLCRSLQCLPVDLLGWHPQRSQD